MGLIQLPNTFVHGHQLPSETLVWNLAHPLLLDAIIAKAYINGFWVNLLTNKPAPVQSGVITRSYLSQGCGVYTGFSVNQAVDCGAITVSDAALSILGVMSRGSASTGDGLISAKLSGGNGVSITPLTSPTAIFRSNDSTDKTTSGLPSGTLVPKPFAVTADNTTGTFYYGHDSASVSGTFTATTLSGSQNLFLGKRLSTYRAVWCNLIIVLPRTISAREYSEFLSHPYQMFRPAAPRIWVPVSSGGANTDSAASAGSIIITGSAAAGLRALVTAASAGSYTLTGSTAAGTQGQISAASAGAYTITGSASAAVRGLVSAASAGTYTLTGSTAAAVSALVSAASAGQITIAGSTAAALRALASTASAGSYSITGSASAALRALAGAASAGSITLTGAAASGVYTPIGATNSAAEAGSYTLTGSAAVGTRALQSTAAAGSYDIIGSAASAIKALPSAADAGQIILTGSATSALWNRLSAADAGSYVITGASATGGSSAAITDTQKIDLILDILQNKQVLDPVTGLYTLYADDGVTVLYTAPAWEDAAGTIPYSGGCVRRIDAMT